MRRIVLQMMTTLNGRLDDPMAWLSDVCDAQYRDIDALYAGYDTVLVGRATYEEMAAYWPLALSEGSKTNRGMAARMRDYRKLVFSRSAASGLSSWHNVERVIAADDAALGRHLAALKQQPGRDIHLSGGSAFARSVIGLGLVDEFRLFVYPVVSPGESWFSALLGKADMKRVHTQAYPNGVVALHYQPHVAAAKPPPRNFTDMLT